MPPIRYLAIAGGLLLLGATAPVHAGEHFNSLTTNSLTTNSLTTNSLTTNSLTINSLTTNALSMNAVTQNALVATESAIAELNGVAVEAVTLPPPTRL